MKHLRLIFNFYSQNKLPAIILFVTYTLTLLIVTVSMGSYRHVTYTRDLFAASPNKALVYCNPAVDYAQVMDAQGDEMRTHLGKIEEKAKAYKAYSPFATSTFFGLMYNGQRVQASLYNDLMLQTQRPALEEGDWFTPSSNHTDDYYDVVLSGESYAHIKIGTVFNADVLQDGGAATTPLRVRAVGRLSAPYILPAFGTGGNVISANDLYQAFNGMIFLESDALQKTLSQIPATTSTSSNFLAAFHPQASDADKEAYAQFLNEQGITHTYDKIMEYTNELVQNKLRKTLPIPVFFLAIITIALISISVLFVNKKYNEYAIYYLCGCSRVKSFLYMLCGIGLISFTGGLLNVLLCRFYPLLYANGLLNLGQVVIDSTSAWYLVLYALFTLLLSVVIPFAVFRKNTPIEAYRRFES